MITIINNDERQHNLICLVDGVTLKERLIPGMTAIDEKKWKALSSSDYVKALLKKGVISEYKEPDPEKVKEPEKPKTTK